MVSAREILAAVIARYAAKLGGDPMKSAGVGFGTGGNLPMLAQFETVLGAEHEPAPLDCLHEKYNTTYSVVQHSVPPPLPGRSAGRAASWRATGTCHGSLRELTTIQDA